jgi:hypothetical protein
VVVNEHFNFMGVSGIHLVGLEATTKFPGTFNDIHAARCGQLAALSLSHAVAKNDERRKEGVCLPSDLTLGYFLLIVQWRPRMC